MLTSTSDGTAGTGSTSSGPLWQVQAVAGLGGFLACVNTSTMDVALPTVSRHFAASATAASWILLAYMLVTTTLVFVFGRVADMIGRRRMFLAGLALLTLGGLLCGLAPNTGTLIVFRMLQAVGGSMLNPVAMSIITNTFTDARERARAIGIWGGVVGLSMALGPVVGGALVDAAGWRSIFFINVPIGAAAVVLTALFVPESRAPRARRLDPVGQVLMMLLLGCLTFGIIEGPAAGWASPRILTCFVVAAAALVGLVGYERRREEPLLDPRFFASAPFSGATVIAVCGFAALSGFLFLNSLYLQEVRQLSPLNAGLLTLPMALMTAVCAPLSGR